jgi:hypothetical protein
LKNASSDMAGLRSEKQPSRFPSAKASHSAFDRNRTV